MKNVLTAAVAAVALAGTASADLIMTGVMDGPASGGKPKVVELYATADIADLSAYSISRGGNGAALNAGVALDAVSVSAGDFVYIVNSATHKDEFDKIWAGKTVLLNGNVNSNGDDVTALMKGSDIIDIFGVTGEDGTGKPWEHLDSYAYRKANTTADGTFDIGDWDIAAPNTLDGKSPAEVGGIVPFGTFSAVVPEPASLALLGLGGLALISRRRSN